MSTDKLHFKRMVHTKSWHLINIIIRLQNLPSNIKIKRCLNVVAEDAADIAGTISSIMRTNSLHQDCGRFFVFLGA